MEEALNVRKVKDETFTVTKAKDDNGIDNDNEGESNQQ